MRIERKMGKVEKRTLCTSHSPKTLKIFSFTTDSTKYKFLFLLCLFLLDICLKIKKAHVDFFFCENIISPINEQLKRAHTFQQTFQSKFNRDFDGHCHFSDCSQGLLSTI